MPCPHCASADKLFDERIARRELAKLLRRGPSRSTRKLLAGVRPLLPNEGSLLDVGGGVGAIQHDLAARGAGRLTGVDASAAYLAVARSEADRLGYGDRVSQHFGDVVELADDVETADLVTLDRVLCCYPDVDALMGVAVAKATNAVGVVFPKQRWWTRLGVVALNLGVAMTGSAYRAFVHPEARVLALAQEAGFTPVVRDSTWLWNVWVFERSSQAPPTS